MNFKTLLYLIPFAWLLSCNNDDNTFHLKSVKLNEFSQRKDLPKQKLYIKAFSDDLPVALAQTEDYPSDMPLPASLKIYPTANMNLYGKPYHLELWGNINGYIGRCNINMDDYKIVFPIEMEVENDSLNISILGSWE